MQTEGATFDTSSLTEAVRSRELVVVAQTYPPIGGGHSERTVGYLKLLLRMGARVTVVTVSLNTACKTETDGHRFDDLRGVQRVFRLPTFWDHMEQCRWPSVAKKTWTHAVSLLSVPDVFRSWSAAAGSFLTRLYKDKPAPVVFTTSSPYSVHMAGMRFKRCRPDARWVCDFRDPYTTSVSVRPGIHMPVIGNMHRSYEQRVYREADASIINTPMNLTELREAFRLDDRRMHVIPNGYEADLEPLPPVSGDKQTDGAVVLMYVGGVRGGWFEGDFFRGLAALKKRHPTAFEKLSVQFLGATDANFESCCAPIATDLGIRDRLKPLGFHPHRAIPGIMAGADAFLLILPANTHLGWVPQKTYAYMASGRPVLAVVPAAGQTAAYLRETGVGLVCDPADPNAIADELAKLVERKQAGTMAELTQQRNQDAIAGFSKAALAQKLVNVLYDG